MTQTDDNPSPDFCHLIDACSLATLLRTCNTSVDEALFVTLDVTKKKKEYIRLNVVLVTSELSLASSPMTP